MKAISFPLLLLLTAQLACCSIVLAAQVPHTRPTPSISGTSINLDLSSKTASLSAARVLKTGSVVIKVGDSVQTVSASKLLTPAQLLAAYQVASTGSQSLQLGTAGNAIGGTVRIGAQFNSSLADLVIPRGVTAITNMSTNPLRLSGNLNNYGTLLAISTNRSVSSAAINASNIFNNHGALLTTVIPSAQLRGYTNSVSNLDLSLGAEQDIINSGTISSAGNLTLVAGGTINNLSNSSTSGASSVVNGVAQITAARNINLFSGSGRVENSGLIQARGSVSFSSQNNLANLQINNTGGVIEAIGASQLAAIQAGAINVREPGYAGSGNIELLGGDWLADQVNLHGGQGKVEVAVGKMDGKINVEAVSAHVLANTPVLTLGNCTVDGDPTYVNTGGEIQISGTLTETAPLAIVAATDVVAAANNAKIVDHGNPVWIIAGASIDTSTGAATGFANNASQVLPGGALTGGFIQVSASGGSGGNIDFSASTITSGNITIDTSSTVSGAAGGALNLIAVGNGAATGRVIFPSTAGVIAINASGKGNGANGNVRIFAGASSGASSINGITNNGGTGAAGDVIFNAGQITFGGGAGGCASCMSFDQIGVASGNLSSITPTNSTVTITGPINTKGILNVTAGAISVNAGSALNASIIIFGTNSGSNGAITVGSNLTGTQGIDLSTDGTGAVTIANGNSLSVANSLIRIASNAIAFNTATLNAGTGAVTLQPNNDAVSIGVNGGSGTLQLTAGNLAQISAGSIVIGSQNGTAAIDVSSSGTPLSVNTNLTFLGSSTSTFNNNDTILLGSNSLTVSVGGSAVLGTVSGNNVQLSAGTIDVSGTNSSGQVVLTSGSTLTIGSGGISSSGTVTLTSAGICTVAGPVNSNNNNIGITAGGVNLTSLVNAGTGTVTFKPNSSSTSIGINGGAGTFQAGPIDSAHVLADTIVIGSSSQTAAIDLNTPGTALNTSSNLVFLASSSSTSASFTNHDTINLGSKNITVNVGGQISLGTVNSTGTVIFNTNGNVDLSSTGNLTLGASTANALTMSATGAITATSDVIANSAIVVSASGFNTADGITVRGTSFTLSGIPGSSLTVGNNGTINSWVDNLTITSALNQSLILGVAGQSGNLTVSNLGLVILTAPSSDGAQTNTIDIVGSQTSPYGNVILNATGDSQATTIEAGATFTNPSNILVNSPTLNLLGSISGKTFLGAQGTGTIANSNPSVNLDLKNLNGGNFTFQGKSLSILSAGGIVNTATSSTINLSGDSQTGGGALSLIAGFNFSGQSNPPFPPDLGTFQLDGTSNSGKIIDLSKTTINVSAEAFAGTVLAVATGSIKLGPINASATTGATYGGIPGSITIIGQGVTASSIDLSAFLGAGTLSISSGTPTITGGQISISKGVLVGPGAFAVAVPSGNLRVAQITGGRSNITLTTGGTGVISQSSGTIATQGLLSVSSGAKGFILKSAALNLSVHTTPNVFTANVSVTSSVPLALQSSTVGGNLSVVSNGLFAPALSIAKNATVASGANITLTATMTDLNIGTGAILTAGMLNGTELASPAPIIKDNLQHAGSISITSNRGDVKIADNAAITSNGGSISIRTTLGHRNISIGDSPALGPNTLQANGGNIVILSLGSINISAGTTGAHLLARSLGTSAGAITLSGVDEINIGSNSSIQANKNITMTASSALSSLTFGNNDTVKSGAGVLNAGAMTLTSNGTQSFCKLQIGTNADFESNASSLILSAKCPIIFADDSTIKATGGSLTVKSTSSVSIDSGAAAINGVDLIATKLASAGGVISVSAGIVGIGIGGPSVINAAASFKISETNSSGTITIDDGAHLFGAGTSSISCAGNGQLRIGDNVQVSNAGPLLINSPTGFISIGKLGGLGSDISSTGSAGSLKISSHGSLELGAGNLSSATTMSLSSATGEVNLQGTNISNASTATINALFDVDITDGSQISTQKNFTAAARALSANVKVGDQVQIQAGAFGTVPAANQPFDPSQISTRGSITFTAGNSLNIGNDNKWTTIGGSISVIAKATTLQVGSNGTGTNNQFIANGGNIIMLAKGTVSGANGNFFHAIGMGASSSTNLGGGIEVGSGLTSSTALSVALNLKGAPINPSAGSLGAGVGYIGNVNGVILARNKSGNANAINLNSGVHSSSQLLLNGTLPAGARGGAQIFDALTPGATINFDNATFETEAFKPISMLSQIELEELPLELKLVDSETTAVRIGNYNAQLKLLKNDAASTIAPVTHSTISPDSSKLTALIFAAPNSYLLHKKDGTIKLVHGEIFMSATKLNSIRVNSAEIQALKGALLSVKAGDGYCYIRSGGTAGSVVVLVNGRTIMLNVGEELLLTNHKPDQSEIHPQDGLGRRLSHTRAFGSIYATVSDFAIITLMSYPATGLRNFPNSKPIVDRLLKSAASIDMVLKNRGPYTSESR